MHVRLQMRFALSGLLATARLLALPRCALTVHP
jgi:hypothetical protein